MDGRVKEIIYNLGCEGRIKNYNLTKGVHKMKDLPALNSTTKTTTVRNIFILLCLIIKPKKNKSTDIKHRAFGKVVNLRSLIPVDIQYGCFGDYPVSRSVLIINILLQI